MAAIKEFVRYLKKLLMMGELTHVEVFDIGRWINNNKSLRTEWPVYDFCVLLKNVFLTGNLTEVR